MMRILPALTLALFIDSCTVPAELRPGIQDELPSECLVPMDSVSFTARFEENETKTSMTSSGKLLWSEGDMIRVFNADNPSGKVYTLQAGAGTGSGTFSGPALSGSGPYHAVYPASSASSLSGNSLTITLPSVQTYAENSFGPGANPSAGVADKLDEIIFRNICGCLSLTLKGNATISAIRIHTKGEELLHGNATVSNLLAGSPTLNWVSGQEGEALSTMSLDCGSGVTLTSEGKSFYLIVPAGSFGQGFTLEAVSADGNVFVRNGSAGSVTIERSMIRPMPALDYSAQYRAAFLQSSALSAAFTGISAGASMSETCTYVPESGQYAYHSVAGTPGSRYFRFQDWEEGFSIGLTTPYALNSGNTATVSVEALGDTGGIVSQPDVNMKVVKRLGSRVWLADPATGNGFIMMLVEN